MNRKIVAASGAVLLGFLLSGCSKPIPVHFPPPAAPNHGLLVRIAKEAIRTRLPSVRQEDLELRHLDYDYHLDDLTNAATEEFDVTFRVMGSKRKTQEGGTTIFEVDSVDVTVELDGRIGKGGVNSGIEKFRSPDLKLNSSFSSTGKPIWGEPFYPVKLDTPLPKPDLVQLKKIGISAVSLYFPQIAAKDLELRRASFDYMSSPEDGVQSEGFWVYFWIKPSLRITETETETKIAVDEITVFISPTGEVRRENVLKSPSGGTYYKQGAAPKTPVVPSP